MTPPANKSKSSEVSNESSFENCGFVLHVLCIPLTVVYLIWMWVPDETLQAADIYYYPDKAWATTLPTTAFLLFVAAPFLYAAVNRLAVPSVESMDTLVDDYTRLPPLHSTKRAR